MDTKRINPVICMVVIAAQVLAMAATAAGVVMCSNHAGETSVELTCDHAHCSSTTDALHECESNDCTCAPCPCEDEPIATTIVPLLRDEAGMTGLLETGSTGSAPAFLLPFAYPQIGASPARCALDHDIAPDPSPWLRRSVILLI